MNKYYTILTITITNLFHICREYYYLRTYSYKKNTTMHRHLQELITITMRNNTPCVPKFGCKDPNRSFFVVNNTREPAQDSHLDGEQLIIGVYSTYLEEIDQGLVSYFSGELRRLGDRYTGRTYG